MTALGDKNVGGLDIAMDYASGVRSVQGVGYFNGDIERALQINGGTLNEMPQRLAFQVLHGDKDAACVITHVINRANVGMVQAGSGLSFLAKARQGLKIGVCGLEQKLERHQPVKACIFGFINHAHATAAETFQNAVMRDGLADQVETYAPQRCYVSGELQSTQARQNLRELLENAPTTKVGWHLIFGTKGQ